LEKLLAPLTIENTELFTSFQQAISTHIDLEYVSSIPVGYLNNYKMRHEKARKIIFFT